MMKTSRISIIFFYSVFFAGLCLTGCRPEGGDTLAAAWRGYKRYFIIEESGRVVRPADGFDTVSEGQAYAMLRAVWMDDKNTFDRCYRWAERNLSRLDEKGDNLLAWHWKDGGVSDWMPASDADIDYALSLIFGYEKWGSPGLEGLAGYHERARLLLEDIMDNLTFETGSGRLYLSPWITDGLKEGPFPQNPSYYSPAHFRIFYSFTGDDRWLSLADTSYFILDSLADNFADKEGAGLVPDWCAVTAEDEFVPLEGKGTGFGWEAVRIPFRAGLDYLWFEEERAVSFLRRSLRPFLEAEWENNRRVYAEYDYGGSAKNGFENPAFYSCYYIALRVSGSPYADEFLDRANDFLVRDGRDWFYADIKDYYTNSLAWLAEGIKKGIIRNYQSGRTRNE